MSECHHPSVWIKRGKEHNICERCGSILCPHKNQSKYPDDEEPNIVSVLCDDCGRTIRHEVSGKIWRPREDKSYIYKDGAMLEL